MDGRVILLLFVESIIRRDVSLRIKERIYQAAFIFLVLFAVMVIYNDVAKMLPSVYGKDAIKHISSQLSAYQLLASSCCLLASEQKALSSRPDGAKACAVVGAAFWLRPPRASR